MHVRQHSAWPLLCLLAVVGCTGSDGSRAVQPSPTGHEPAPPATHAREPQASTEPAAPPATPSAPGAATPVFECTKNAINRSRCMIEAVLDDVRATYPHLGGGGISELRQVATDSYALSIAQEERLDVITYKLAVDGQGHVVISERTESTKSQGP